MSSVDRRQVCSNRASSPSSDQSEGNSSYASSSSYTDIYIKREEEGAKIRVGRQYQAEIPVLRPPNEDARYREDALSHDVVIWQPPDHALNADELLFLTEAKESYGYAEEQALGLLFWHNFNVRSAREDLPEFVPEGTWSSTEKLMFETAFQAYGKSFSKIHAQFPDKSLLDVIEMYYKTKKKKMKIHMPDSDHNRSVQVVIQKLPY